MQRLAAEQRNLEEQQRRQHEAAAAELRRSQNHEVNANASPDVKQTLKVSWNFRSDFNDKGLADEMSVSDLFNSETNRKGAKSKFKLEQKFVSFSLC